MPRAIAQLITTQIIMKGNILYPVLFRTVLHV